MKEKDRLERIWIDFRLGIFPKTSEDWILLFKNCTVSEEVKNHRKT